MSIWLIHKFTCFNLAIASLSSTLQYSLYWSGHSSTNNFDGKSNASFLSVWEAGNFSITATRFQESYIPAMTNPPGKPARFDGRLRRAVATIGAWGGQGPPTNRFGPPTNDLGYCTMYSTV